MRIAISLLLGALSARAYYQVPGANECILWKDDDYEGNPVRVKLNTSACGNGSASRGDPQDPTQGTVLNVSDRSFNDKMSSYACGANVIFDFCNNNPGDDCNGGNGIHGAGPSRSAEAGQQDRLTTFYGTCKNPEAQPAMIFADTDCRGQSIRVDADGRVTYADKDEIDRLGLGNDTASSVMVPLGYMLKLYEDAGQQGNAEERDGKPVDGDSVMVCQNLERPDKMSSYAYYKQAADVLPVNGKWVDIGPLYAGQQTFTFTTSTTSTNSEATTTSMQAAITASMTMGWKYPGANASATVSSAFTETLTNAVTTTLAQGSSQSVTVTCKSSKYPDPWGQNLYQWYGMTADGEVTVATGLKQCRFNELAKKAPACPPSACVMSAENPTCEVCNPAWEV